MGNNKSRFIHVAEIEEERSKRRETCIHTGTVRRWNTVKSVDAMANRMDSILGVGYPERMGYSERAGYSERLGYPPERQLKSVKSLGDLIFENSAKNPMQGPVKLRAASQRLAIVNGS